MQKMLSIAAIAAAVLVGPQLAPAQNSAEPDSQGSLRHQVKNRLEQAGFTNVRVIPKAFLVRANDPDGNPVMMMVNASVLTALSRGNPSSQQQQGQVADKSAKTTDNPAYSTSSAEENYHSSKSNKVSGSAMSQTGDGEKMPGKANAMTAELGQNEAQPLTLTNSQREAIWEMLGNQAGYTGPNLHDGQVVPDEMILQALPNTISNQIPAVKTYDYTMLNNQVLIVHPVTKRILAVVAD